MIELMKAIVPDADDLKWSDIHFPKPSGSNQVLIKVKAAGVNRPDILQRKGLYNPPSDASPILGLEVSGTIEQVYGESKRWKYGDKVCALTHGGGYGQYVWVDDGHCLPIPDGFSFEEAASIPETYFTVWFNLFIQGNLGVTKREHLLVHAGASGIGVAAIQLAKAFGNKVFATVRRREQMELCKEIGADDVVVLDDHWVEKVKTRSRGIDVVLDILGKRTFDGNIDVLRPQGRILWLAFLTGQHVSFSIQEIMRKQLVLTGSFLRPQKSEVKAMIARELEEKVWPLFWSRTIKPTLYATFPIQEVNQAHRMMEEGGHFGKIVLSIA